MVRSGRARRKTSPRTSAQSPRQLERVTLLLFLLTIYLPFLLQSSCSLLYPTLLRFALPLTPSPSALPVPPSRSIRFLLSSLAFAPFHRRHPLRVVSSSSSSLAPSTATFLASLLPAASGPRPSDLFLSHPPLIVSFTFSQPLVEQAEPRRDGVTTLARLSTSESFDDLGSRPRRAIKIAVASSPSPFPHLLAPRPSLFPCFSCWMGHLVNRHGNPRGRDGTRIFFLGTRGPRPLVFHLFIAAGSYDPRKVRRVARELGELCHARFINIYQLAQILVLTLCGVNYY